MKKTNFGITPCSIFTIEKIDDLLPRTVTPMCIHYFGYSTGMSLSINYRYDVPANTVGHEGIQYISKKMFDKKIKELEKEMGITISIKTSWAH